MGCPCTPHGNGRELAPISIAPRSSALTKELCSAKPDFLMLKNSEVNSESLSFMLYLQAAGCSHKREAILKQMDAWTRRY